MHTSPVPYYVTTDFLLPSGEADLIEDLELEIRVLDFEPGSPASWDDPGEGPWAEVEIALDGRVLTDGEAVRLGADWREAQRKAARACARQAEEYGS